MSISIQLRVYPTRVGRFGRKEMIKTSVNVYPTTRGISRNKKFGELGVKSEKLVKGMNVNLNSLIVDEVGENNEDWDNPFDYWYELDDRETEHIWGEMSYNRLDKKTGWEDFELSEMELYNLELN
jgi:hypothetical protein